LIGAAVEKEGTKEGRKKKLAQSFLNLAFKSSKTK
jgi:hypothetical protein